MHQCNGKNLQNQDQVQDQLLLNTSTTVYMHGVLACCTGETYAGSLFSDFSFIKNTQVIGNLLEYVCQKLSEFVLIKLLQKLNSAVVLDLHDTLYTLVDSNMQMQWHFDISKDYKK